MTSPGWRSGQSVLCWRPTTAKIGSRAHCANVRSRWIRAGSRVSGEPAPDLDRVEHPFYYSTSDGSLIRRFRDARDAPGALGQRSSTAGWRAWPGDADRPRLGDRGRARPGGPAPRGAGRGRRPGPPTAPRTHAARALGSAPRHPRPGRRRAHRAHRVRRPGRDPRDRRTASLGDRRASGKRQLGQDDARAAGRGRGPGRRRHRRVAGPRPLVRSRGGRRAWRQPGVARGADAGGPRGGARDVRLAPRGPDRGPARGGPAGRAGPGDRGQAGGGPARPARGAGPAVGGAARGAGAAVAGPEPRRRDPGGERPVAGDAPRGLDPAGPGRRGATERRLDRAQPLRAARPSRGPRDPLRGRGRPGRLSRPRPAARRARHARRPTGHPSIAGTRGRGTVPGNGVTTGATGIRATTIHRPPERPPPIA